MIGCLAGLLTHSMRRLNAEVVVKGKSYAEVASEFLSAATPVWIAEATAVARDRSETPGCVICNLMVWRWSRNSAGLGAQFDDFLAQGR